MTSLQRTPLFEFHRAHGGRFVDFAGWEMPVQYRSILEEHKAVRRSAGLFDVSHMGEVDVKGPQAEAFLNFLVTNDVPKLYPGKVLYTPMCYPSGGVVDDLLIYRRGPEDFLLCINAGNTAKDLDWIRQHANSFRCELTDRSAETALLALQGPRAAEILRGLTPADLNSLKYYHCVQSTVAGAPCFISRTGYTGEDGFELFCGWADAEGIAERLLEAGEPHDLALCGLGSRDSLRLEAGYPLYGHEITREISPLQAGLGWTVKLAKATDFLGKESLAREKEAGPARKVVFFRTGDRRIVRAGAPVLDALGQAGEVVSGTLSPILNESIGSALVRTGAEDLFVEIRGERIALQLVKPPFVPLKK